MEELKKALKESAEIIAAISSNSIYIEAGGWGLTQYIEDMHPVLEAALEAAELRDATIEAFKEQLKEKEDIIEALSDSLQQEIDRLGEQDG